MMTSPKGQNLLGDFGLIPTVSSVAVNDNVNENHVCPSRIKPERVERICLFHAYHLTSDYVVQEGLRYKELQGFRLIKSIVELN